MLEYFVNICGKFPTLKMCFTGLLHFIPNTLIGLKHLIPVSSTWPIELVEKLTCLISSLSWLFLVCSLPVIPCKDDQPNLDDIFKTISNLRSSV